jgi:hypothetical protein
LSTGLFLLRIFIVALFTKFVRWGGFEGFKIPAPVFLLEMLFMRHIPFCSLSVIALFCACSNNTNWTGETVHPLECLTLESLDGRVASCSLIELSMPEGGNLASIQKILMDADHNFIVFDTRKNIIKFSPNGKFICRIGRQGRGPGEYTALQDISLDSAGKNIYLLSLGKVIEYATDGKYVTSYDVPAFNYDAIAPSSKGFFLVVTAPNYKLEDLEQEHNMVHLYSVKDNKVVKENLLRKEYVLNIDLVSFSLGSGYFLRPLEGEDVLYHMSGDKLEPRFRVDFGNLSSPENYIFEDGRVDMSKFVVSPYYKVPSRYQKTKDYQYFSAVGPDACISHYVFTSDNTPFFSWTDKSYAIAPIYALSSDEEFFYFCIDDPLSLFSLSPEELDPMARYIVDKYKDHAGHSTDSPWIMKLSFR